MNTPVVLTAWSNALALVETAISAPLDVSRLHHGEQPFRSLRTTRAPVSM
jgi:hypothetical protein